MFLVSKENLLVKANRSGSFTIFLARNFTDPSFEGDSDMPCSGDRRFLTPSMTISSDHLRLRFEELDAPSESER
jgi:hypothetical protein